MPRLDAAGTQHAPNGDGGSSSTGCPHPPAPSAPGRGRHLADVALLIPHGRRQAGRLPRHLVGPPPPLLLPCCARCACCLQVSHAAAGAAGHAGHAAAAALAAQAAQQRPPRRRRWAGHIGARLAQQAGCCAAGQIGHQRQQAGGSRFLGLVRSHRRGRADCQDAHAVLPLAPTRHCGVEAGRRRPQAQCGGAGACGGAGGWQVHWRGRAGGAGWLGAGGVRGMGGVEGTPPQVTECTCGFHANMMPLAAGTTQPAAAANIPTCSPWQRELGKGQVVRRPTARRRGCGRP